MVRLEDENKQEEEPKVTLITENQLINSKLDHIINLISSILLILGI